MKKMTYLFLLAATLGACSPKPENKIETPPKASASLFPQGDAIEGSNFNGTAYLQRLMTDSETFDVVVSDVIRQMWCIGTERLPTADSRI